MGRNARRKTATSGLRIFGAGIVTGVASLTSFGHSATPWRYPHESTAAALRSDWLRVGRDMEEVIRREHARVKETKK